MKSFIILSAAVLVIGTGCVTPAQTERANATVADVGTRVSDTTSAVGRVGPTVAGSITRAVTDTIGALRAILDAAIGTRVMPPAAAPQTKADAAPTPDQKVTLRGEDVDASGGWQPKAKQELRDKLASSQ